VLPKILRVTVCVVLATSMAWAAKPTKNVSCPAWSDTFTSGQLDASRWVVPSSYAPGTSTLYNNTSYYDPINVVVTPGLLQIDLTQVANGSGYISYGGAVHTKQVCGYGTYQWTMQMSSTAICPGCSGQAVSGSVSAGFVYVNNSQTEIDFEYSAIEPNSIHLVNWLNTNPNQAPTGGQEASDTYSATGFSPINGLHTYKFVWTQGKISYYIDGIFIVTHPTNVPTAPAYFWINHWGTNSPWWGGQATTGVARHMYVTQVSYTP
jgi:beta-glucanase (GH16 family)